MAGRFRIRSILVLIVIVGLALVVQRRSALRREAELRAELQMARVEMMKLQMADEVEELARLLQAQRETGAATIRGRVNNGGAAGGPAGEQPDPM